MRSPKTNKTIPNSMRISHTYGSPDNAKKLSMRLRSPDEESQSNTKTFNVTHQINMDQTHLDDSIFIIGDWNDK